MYVCVCMYVCMYVHVCMLNIHEMVLVPGNKVKIDYHDDFYYDYLLFMKLFVM